MKTTGKLIKLKSDEIKKIWPIEKNLSVWIEKNINFLNKILNLNIDIEGREEYVHNFRLDLVGIENNSKMPVIIENQFGRSDHDHLGKLLTYSAAKEAGIIIWIANEIQIAHRTAIDWLNKISPEEMSFFCVELEVFKIDNSLPAPNFRVVAGTPPSIFPGLSPRNKRYFHFFDCLRKKILEIQPDYARAKALPQSWWSIGIGRFGFSLNTCFTIDNKFRVEIYIDTGNKESTLRAFEVLKENRVNIEAKIGRELVWGSLPERRACRIYIAIDGSLDDEEQKHKEIISWAYPIMLKFKEIFSPLVKNIQIDG